MFWFVVIVLAFAALWFCRGNKRPEPDQDIGWHSPDLEAIQRRLGLARFKYEVRRDAALARRELREDLRRLRDRER